jgi:4-hydroxy-tetrahydrodipicolinate reductase
MKRVVLVGTGLMGQRVAELLERHAEASLMAMVSRNRPDWAGDTPWFDQLDELEDSPELVIDFSLPGGTRSAADWCRANLVPLVSGTTGLGETERRALRKVAELAPVLWAPNLSKGFNLLLRAVVETAVSLPHDTPVEILDVHHVHKKDAPSGTSLLLAHGIVTARGDSPEHAISTGMEPAEPSPGMVHCVSRREGEVIGDHCVTFFGRDERIELGHYAQERGIYAAGAIDAGLWLLEQPAGLYSAADWLKV